MYSTLPSQTEGLISAWRTLHGTNSSFIVNPLESRRFESTSSRHTSKCETDSHPPVVRLLSAVKLKAASVPESVCPTRNLSVTCDDHLRLYIDGVEITDLTNANQWPYVDSVDLPCTARLVAIHGRNGLGNGAILASTNDDYILTNSTWKCSNVSQFGWVDIDFDDSAWMAATEHGGNGETIWSNISEISPHATWIWRRQWNGLENSTYEEMDLDVYCRRKLGIDLNCKWAEKQRHKRKVQSEEPVMAKALHAEVKICSR